MSWARAHNHSKVKFFVVDKLIRGGQKGGRVLTFDTTQPDNNQNIHPAIVKELSVYFYSINVGLCLSYLSK